MSSSPASPAKPPPQQLVLGTAGHIDHGKTALVQALTGVDTDRLAEEKARGITIELGFAPLDLGDGLLLGVVDVPGHERLVRTMVAGASGIDLVLLVVAADEGVMPQTREHVAICSLLGVERGVVALTKVDLVDEETLELAGDEVCELLAETSLAGAPLVQTSATSGDGIDELRRTLKHAARDALKRTRPPGPPRLPVDRVFAMRGFGTVVTGTLAGSPLSVGIAVELLPSGKRARIRGLQRHGASVERIEPGTRCAVNLQGLEVSEIERGEVLSVPQALAPTRVLDARVQWLASAPALEGQASVEFLAGTAERRASIAPLGASRLAPGASGYARLHLEGALLALLPGDRCVLRGFARTELGGATLGGGVILDVAPPRRRRSDPALVRDLERLARHEPENDVLVRVERAALAGVERIGLRQETGLSEAELERLLAGPSLRGRIAVGHTGTCLAEGAAQAIAQRVEQALGAFHAREPLQPGMPLAALRGALPANVPRDAVELVLERLVAAGRARVEEDRVRRADHRAALSGEERELADRLLGEARKAGLEPPTLKEWSERLGRSTGWMRKLLTHLERNDALVRAPGDLWFDRRAVEELRDRLVARLREAGSIETPDYKTLIGTTRKHAVPLMELFDAEHLTLRVGNRRVLRSGKGS
jgi:selenocysteine-specific elongation factor